MKEHICVDCKNLAGNPAGDPSFDLAPKTPRPAPHGGPRSKRCTTHYRAWKRAQRLKARVNRSQKVYGLQPDQRAQLLDLQNGKCPICLRGLDMDSRGRWSRTAHDHDHELAKLHDHPENEACEDCMRGLTCGWCNRELLARIDLAAARRLVSYHENPPMAQLRAAQTKESA